MIKETILRANWELGAGPCASVPDRLTAWAAFNDSIHGVSDQHGGLFTLTVNGLGQRRPLSSLMGLWLSDQSADNWHPATAYTVCDTLLLSTALAQGTLWLQGTIIGAIQQVHSTKENNSVYLVHHSWVCRCTRACVCVCAGSSRTRGHILIQR